MRRRVDVAQILQGYRIVTEAILIQADRKADSEQRIVYGVFGIAG